MRFAAACFAAALLTATCSADFDLVRDGAPVAQIVVPEDAPEFVTLAAGELNLYLRKMSGAELPVVAEAAGEAPVVYLGAPDDDWAAQAKPASLAFDGFVVECDGGRLVLAGKVPEGTLNAVYWLLEELGVRWFIPTELGENVPQRETVTVPDMNRRVEPRFVCRRNHGIDQSIKPDGDIWRRRARITSHALNVPFNRYSHNLYKVFPASKYGETHPEYYPLINGRRRIPETDHAQNWQPCTSNPDVVRLTIEYGRRWFEEHPEANFFSVGINDSGCFCECDNCTALDIPGETFRGRPMVSDRYFTFVKQVADGLRESNPDKYVTCIAYGRVEAPPRRIKLPDNVLVVITQDIAQWHDPAYRQADMDFARAWVERTGAFGTYNYTGLTWTLPRVYPHLMAEALRFYDEVGAVAVTNEAYPTWWYAGPMVYLRAKLMWDPQQDPDAVLDDFYSGFFGPARKPMKRFYDILEARMMKQRPGRWFEGLGSVLDQIALWERRDLNDCRSALQRARKLTGDAEPYASRVDFVARGFAYTDAILEEYWLARRVRELGASATADVAEVADTLEEFLTASAHREQVWESIRDDELISGIYTRILEVRPQRLASWRMYLANAPAQAYASLMSRADELPAGRIERLAARAPEHLAFNIRAMHWATTHPEAPNLCANPGFEQTDGEEAPPEGMDWVTTDVPRGWSKWEIDGRPELLTWEQTGGRDDPRCVKVTGSRNGCFIQSVPVEPGEAYFARIWVRSTGSSEAVPQFVIRWRDADGKWTRNEKMLHVQAEGGADRWQELILVFIVPDGAAQAVLLPGAKDQRPGDATIFDDARMVKLPEDSADAGE
ncbi:MAG: DUF4838 domain-containing protein [Armatimonadetes bacterium]|nr:DUF4838 domain-containing protein [Armatimonadota bacterium]